MRFRGLRPEKMSGRERVVSPASPWWRAKAPTLRLVSLEPPEEPREERGERGLRAGSDAEPEPEPAVLGGARLRGLDCGVPGGSRGNLFWPIKFPSSHLIFILYPPATTTLFPLTYVRLYGSERERFPMANGLFMKGECF